ncbi:MAG TPA: rod shape-determining protein MreC [Solirubrobacteraceae bacterium]|jgi:rod shape-determining protein MreC|nr:rod shape-determining protein MreC [Solirubrobacteraceae bacterium]
MSDKVVRRRRAVLAVLVLISLCLLTAYFGESSSGSLHSVQRGAMEVFAPIQEGANRALKPFRDLFGWFGDTLDAKEERDKLRAERDALRKDVARVTLENRELEQIKGLQAQNSAGGLDDYEPVQARVIARSPSSWFQSFQINKGSSDGVRVDQPVVNSAGLVGKVKEVSDGNAVVMLLTDPEFGVSAQTLESGEPGSVGPAVGDAGDLRFELVPNAKEVRRGERIITAGTSTSAKVTQLSSLYPRGILIGTVSRIETGEGELDRVIHVEPVADLRSLDLVEVLTQPDADLRAQAP